MKRGLAERKIRQAFPMAQFSIGEALVSRSVVTALDNEV